MDTILVLQVLTLLVSLLSVSLTFVLGRSTNKINTVFKHRAINKSKVQDAAAVLFKYTVKEALPLIEKEDVFEASEAAGVISSVLKYRYPIAKNIIDLANKIVEELAKYVINGKVDDSAILSARQEFYIAFSKYDLTEWRFLKYQANGETRGSDDYDRIYLKVLEEFKRSESKKRNQDSKPKDSQDK